jgi:tRNA A37 threonylcarbamoyladenosine modification protein TsaB
MTISLTIDTATSKTIVALLDGEKVLYSNAHEGATDHGRAVSELVAEALANNPAPGQVIVGMGPGPYTGLRVGIDARRKEIYWATYRDGVRVVGPNVSKPDEAPAHIFGLTPSPQKMVSLAQGDTFEELFYLRRPDAVPTAERS